MKLFSQLVLTTSRPHIPGNKLILRAPQSIGQGRTLHRNKGLLGCFACATRADGCAIHRTRTEITYHPETAPITHARSGVRPTAGVGRVRPVAIAPDLDSRIDHRLPAPAINAGRVCNAPPQLSPRLHWRKRFASRMYRPSIGSLR